MKLIIINYRRFLVNLPILLLAILIICLISAAGLEALGVYTETKQIPIYSVETEDKVASITFDCAWGADDIPQILDTLNQKQVKATFFIVGQWAEKHPAEVRLIASQGHDIGNHSYSHLRMGALDRERLVSEIQKCGSILDDLSGLKTDLFRAPFGDYSNSTVSVAQEFGYYAIQWNVDSLDWKPGISKAEIKNRISGKIIPGSIILFHNDTAYTSEILPEIIDTLKNQGYEFKPISRLIIRQSYYLDHTGRQFIKK